MPPTSKATQVKSENLSDDDDNLQKQIRAVAKQTSTQNSRDREARARRPKTAGQAENGSRPHDAGVHDLPPNQSGWPVFFALLSSFSRETEFTTFVSEETATACSRHNSRRRRIPMPASPRHRAHCNRHEARIGSVALVSCCLVRLSNGRMGTPDETALSLPACTRRNICRGAALASRLDPLAFSGSKRGRSKALFFLAMLNGTSISNPDVSLPSRLQKTSSPHASASLLELRLYHHSIGFPLPLRTTFPHCLL